MDDANAKTQGGLACFSIGRLRMVFSRTILGPKLGFEVRYGSWHPEDGRLALTFWHDRNRLTITLQERKE